MDFSLTRFSKRAIENIQRTVELGEGIVSVSAKQGEIQGQLRLLSDNLNGSSNLSSNALQDVRMEIKSNEGYLLSIARNLDWLSDVVTATPTEVNALMKDSLQAVHQKALEELEDRYHNVNGLMPKSRARIIKVSQLSSKNTKTELGRNTKELSAHCSLNTQPSLENGTGKRVLPRFSLAKRRLFHKRTASILGLYEVGAYLLQDYSEQSGDVVRIEVSLVPNPWLWKRGLEASIWYDRAQGLHSLTNIRLHCPGIRKADDPIITVLRNGTPEELSTAMRKGYYRPDDLFVHSDGQNSFLSVRIIFDLLKPFSNSTTCSEVLA